jgi:hypothetical protein
MSFLFVSHASVDKAARVRPLVEVLIEEGETVWIDRPGRGENDFGFDQAYIDRNDIDHLLSGRPWSTGIQSALRASGAVIGCLSRSLLEDRAVLEGELTYADTAEKLVTCIVDDLPFEDLARYERGLFDPRKHQSPRIDCARLAEALERRAAMNGAVEELPRHLAVEWEKVRNLVGSANRVRREPRPLRTRDIGAAAAVLRAIPVGPILHVSHVPAEVIQAFGEWLGTPERVDAALDQAMTLIKAAFPEGYTERQILVRRGQLPGVGTLSGEALWIQIFSVAGLKARRTLAAFLTAPIGRWALERSGAGSAARSFLDGLRKPGSYHS